MDIFVDIWTRLRWLKGGCQMLLGLSALLWSKRASSSREVRMAIMQYLRYI